MMIQISSKRMSLAAAKIISLTTGVLWLAGCSQHLLLSPPDYQAPVAQLPAQFKHQPVKYQTSWQAMPQQSWLLSPQWWELFNDSVLNGLQQQALSANQTLAQSAARYRQAEALLKQADATRRPQLGAQAGATRQGNQHSASSSYKLGLNASWTPDLWGRIAKQIEVEQAGVAASVADMAAVQLTIQTLLAQTYFQLRVSDQQIRLLQDTYATYDKSWRLINNQYQAGLVARADVIQADTQRQGVLVEQTRLKRQRALQQNALAVLVGEMPSSFELLANTAELATPGIPAQIPSVLVSQRPDVVRAERQLAATHARLGLAKTAWLPDFNLSAEAALNSSKLVEIVAAPQRVWSLGLAVAANMLDGDARKAKIKQAEAVYDEQVAAYREAVLTGIKEVEDALLSLNSLAEEKRQQATLVDLAKQNEQVVSNRYQAGLVNYLEMANAQNLTLNARMQQLNTDASQLQGSVQLIAALGGGWRQSQ